MTLMEVKYLLQKLDEQGLNSAYLVTAKPHKWRPKGFKLRTCFGLAKILSVIEKSDENQLAFTSIVFTVEKAKIIKWLKKAESLELHRTYPANTPIADPAKAR